MTSEKILKLTERIQKMLEKCEDDILLVLEQIETYKTAKSEIAKSLFCLRNIVKQINYLSSESFSDLCVFLPLNQPLYSLVLFVIIPSCMLKRVYCRPPVLLRDVYSKLIGILNLDELNIICESISRSAFLDKRISNADAVIYTGQYENALDVMNAISPRTIFIYQGSAANPIVITHSAIITDELINKVVESQMYNSGQDCMAPAVIFVSNNNWIKFTDKLIARLRLLKIGAYNNAETDVAPVIESKTIENATQLLHSNKTSIIYGGEIDSDKQIIFPTIISFDNVDNLPYCSSFSPIFSLYRYKSETEVSDYLFREECQENKAYVSIFGNFGLGLGNEVVIMNDILDSVDDGYSEFGGYGIRSGFISYDNIVTSKPILISRELAMYKKSKKGILPIGDLDNPEFETSIVFSNVDLLNKTVLEVGCGTTPHAKILAPRCKSYFAIDTNNGKIEEALSYNILEMLKIETMNGAKIHVAPKTFDVALMFHCLHEVRLDEQGAILKEIYRVLKECGTLLIIDAVRSPISDFQRCFDIVHEEFLDYKHVYGVQHAEWITSEYVKREYFYETKNEIHNMVFKFTSINNLADCLIRSFTHEYEWNDNSKCKLVKLLNDKFNNNTGDIELEEIVSIRVLKKVSKQR